LIVGYANHSGGTGLQFQGPLKSLTGNRMEGSICQQDSRLLNPCNKM
jgi:hypothetical protein